MAVRDWHAGQLASYWIALGLVYITVMAIGRVYVDDLLIPGSIDWERVTNAILLVLALLLVLVLVGFVVTWRWFGARRRAR